MLFIREVWYGQRSLAQTYWLCYWVIPVSLDLVGRFLLDTASSALGSLFPFHLFYALSLPYLIWIGVGLWRSATKHAGFWAALVKIQVVLLPLNLLWWVEIPPPLKAYKIPAASMEIALLVGDHILVNKWAYWRHGPKREDIIVFQYLWEEDRDFIKRVIGLPGDRVYVRDWQVYVNDQPLHEPYVHYTSSFRQEQGNFGPVVVPKKGDRIEIRSDKHLYLNGEPVPIPAGTFRPRNDSIPMTGLDVFYGALLPPGTTLQHTLEPRPVEHDYYFVLGDHRDNSQDSRYWGFVRSTRLKGRAFFIYWSWDREGSFVHHVRWDRLGKLL